LQEYQKAPRVTRDRLYLEAVEEVYGNSNKVIIDSKATGNMLYLPLDQIMRNENRSTPGSETNRASDAQTPEVVASPERSATEGRERVTREPR